MAAKTFLGCPAVLVRKRIYRTFQNLGKNKAALLDFGEDFPHRFGFRCQRKRLKDLAGHSRKCRLRMVEKFIIRFRSCRRQQESLHVNGPESRGPFKALEPASKVLRRGQLAAAVAAENGGNGHRRKW